MIPSVEQRSQSDIWSDFLSILGKNCNTSSILRIDNILILPQGIEVADIIKKLSLARGERYLLVLNHLYFRGIYRKKTAKESGNFLPVHRNTLVQIGGNRYKALLDYGMKNARHIIKSPKNYVVGAKCYEYRLNEDTVDFSRQQTYTLTLKAPIAVWKNRSIKRRTEFVKDSPARKKISDSIDGLRFDYAKAFSYVAGMTDAGKQHHRTNVLSHLITNGQLWSVDRQKRNYTILVVVPRDIRQFFSYLGQPLFTIDIKSSQPLLHSLLYSEDSPEKIKYLSAVQTDFWDFINKTAGSLYDLTDPDQKDLLKDKMWAQVFYGWKEEKPKPKAVYARAFEREFPILWEKIQRAKDKGNKPLPCEMQFLEADQVLSAVGRLVGQPYPLITIHDAIVTTKDGVDAVTDAVMTEFANWGLKPRLTVKQLTA